MTSAIERVLVLRALGLGDTYAAVPALRGVRRRWPRAEIAIAAPPSLGHLMLSHGIVDRVVPAKPLKVPHWAGPPPDVAVNLHGSGPESHRLLSQLSPRVLVAFHCPAAGFEDGPDWNPGEHEVDRWCRLVNEAGGECSPADLRLPPLDVVSRELDSLPVGPIVVHPGAAAASRRWPQERWTAVARALATDGWPVAVTGGPGERSLCRRVAAAHERVTDLSGRLDATHLAALIGRARLLLCGDTGVAHLATAYGTPSVLIFGPTPPERWGPRIDQGERGLHRVLWRPEPGDPPGDPHGRHVDVRLLRVGVQDVLEEAFTLLDAVGSGSAHWPPRN